MYNGMMAPLASIPIPLSPSRSVIVISIRVVIFAVLVHLEGTIELMMVWPGLLQRYAAPPRINGQLLSCHCKNKPEKQSPRLRMTLSAHLHENGCEVCSR